MLTKITIGNQWVSDSKNVKRIEKNSNGVVKQLMKQDRKNLWCLKEKIYPDEKNEFTSLIFIFLLILLLTSIEENK